MIETTCELYDRKLKELTGNSGGFTPVRISFNPSDVESFREHINDDEVEPSTTECMVYFKSGESLVIGMSYDELKAALKAQSASPWEAQKL